MEHIVIRMTQQIVYLTVTEEYKIAFNENVHSLHSNAVISTKLYESNILQDTSTMIIITTGSAKVVGQTYRSQIVCINNNRVDKNVK